MYGSNGKPVRCTCPECSGHDAGEGDTIARRAMHAYVELLSDEFTTLVAYPNYGGNGGLYVELVDRAADAEIVLAKGRVA